VRSFGKGLSVDGVEPEPRFERRRDLVALAVVLYMLWLARITK
jgi:hypothetical protein